MRGKNIVLIALTLLSILSLILSVLIAAGFISEKIKNKRGNTKKTWKTITLIPFGLKNEMDKDKMSFLLAPSMIVICVCITCLCSTSRAWFTDMQKKAIMNVETAVYTVDVTATRKISSETEQEETNSNTEVASVTFSDNAYEVVFEAGDYEITIQTTGTASTGYCKVLFEDNAYYTLQIGKNESLSFSVKANEKITLTIIPQWGTYSGMDDEDKIVGNSELVFGKKQNIVNDEAVEDGFVIEPSQDEDDQAEEDLMYPEQKEDKDDEEDKVEFNPTDENSESKEPSLPETTITPNKSENTESNTTADPSENPNEDMTDQENETEDLPTE